MLYNKGLNNNTWTEKLAFTSSKEKSAKDGIDNSQTEEKDE